MGSSVVKMPPLFNVNGSFGCGSTARPDFRCAGELLAHMDRLGVDRSLVWHLPAGSNDEMMAEIESTAGAAERLVPAYAIAPKISFQPQAITRVRDAISSGKVRALRVLLTDFFVRLSPMGTLMREIAPYKPVLLFSYRESLDIDALHAFAAEFPEVPMIVLQANWANQESLYDLMRSHANIYADTSWFHMTDIIEETIREFGVERIVFGLGSRSNNGASIAALMRAEISDSEKALIAHGNLDRLLGLSTVESCGAPVKTTGFKGCNYLWDKVIAGQALDVDIVDAHGHLGDIESIETTLREMDRLGVDTLIASGWRALNSDPVQGNVELAELVKPFGERLRGYVSFNPHYHDELVPKLPELFADPFFVGFKLLCSYWAVSVRDPRFAPVWEYADAHRLPILLHTWTDPYDSPALLKDIVKKHPNAIFLIGHSGGEDAGRIEAEALAADNRNVYLEFCGSYKQSFLWEDTVKRLGSDRVVFGTDVTAHAIVWELGRFLSLELPIDELVAMLGANMRKILALRR